MGATPVSAIVDREMPFKFRVLSGFADAVTAPSSTYNCTITLTDGTTSHAVVIAATAKHGENKTITATPILANTDFDVTLVDDNASAVTADITFCFVCEVL